HDRQHERRREEADAEERCTEEREPTQVLVQPVASWSNRRNDDEDAPEPIDHAGDGREQRDDILQNALEPAWNEFLRQEYGDGDAEHRGKGDPDGRTHHRPDDLWQDSELPLAGVPMSRDNEPRSVLENGGHGLLRDQDHDERDDEGREASEDPGYPLEESIDRMFARRRRPSDLFALLCRWTHGFCPRVKVWRRVFEAPPAVWRPPARASGRSQAPEQSSADDLPGRGAGESSA